MCPSLSNRVIEIVNAAISAIDAPWCLDGVNAGGGDVVG